MSGGLTRQLRQIHRQSSRKLQTAEDSHGAVTSHTVTMATPMTLCDRS